MPTLLHDIVQTSLGRVKAELARDQTTLPVPEVRELVVACCAEEPLVRGLWEGICQRLDGGIEAKQLAIHLREVADVIEAWWLNFVQVRDRVLATLGPEGGSDELARLADSAAKVQALREKIVQLRKQAEAPPPRVDPATLRTGGRSADAEGFRDVVDILKRLQAGEDV
jgi:hypothetical protein